MNRDGPAISERSTSLNYSAGTILRNKDAKQVLIGLGFPEKRAEKALAATGGNSVQEATEWLLQHVYDPTLDQSVPREYVVYACPGGELGAQLDEFYDTSLLQCGWNGSHKLFPHVTLCQFFKCEDHMMSHVIHILQKSYSSHTHSAPDTIITQRFLSQGYIGLFLEEEGSDWLRQVLNTFSLEMKKHGVTVEPHRKQLHITLAHQYRPDHQTALEALCRKINPTAPSSWELRLYSRDQRLATAEVYRVVYQFTPTHDDELQLLDGDYVFVPTNQQTESEGWMMGVSTTTGLSGHFPSNYVERCRESDCWALHRSYSVAKVTKDVTAQYENKTLSRQQKLTPMPEPMYDNANGLLPSTTGNEATYAKVNKLKKSKTASPPPGPLGLFLFRHAERVDVTFGKQWIELSFDSDGVYQRKNLNMPRVIPHRQGSPKSFHGDTPLTEMGLYQARITGEGLREQDVTFTHVYSSPSLRCIQTCQAILDGMGADPSLRINVEHGLFEWLAWCRGNVPQFMTLQELEQFGLRVNHHYETQVKIKELRLKESCGEYYKRSYNIVRIILKMASKSGSKVLIVGHAGSLEACSRQLVGGAPRNTQELTKIVQSVPYCGLCVCQEHPAGGGEWTIVEPPLPPLTHAPNVRYDWRLLRS